MECLNHGSETYISYSKDKCCSNCFKAIIEKPPEPEVEKYTFTETNDDYRVLKGDEVVVCNNKFAEDFAYTLTMNAYKRLTKESKSVSINKTCECGNKAFTYKKDYWLCDCGKKVSCDEMGVG